MKMMAGCRAAAALKRARTSFSASPCHREVREAALMLKKVARDSLARACVCGVWCVSEGEGGMQLECGLGRRFKPRHSGVNAPPPPRGGTYTTRKHAVI
jgi:hypothetical protein